ncbi:MAG: hypothetical protein GC185_04390 [Alphaproteobacteria bacterium]|nr:hypothetical protein [Alphaproteobacteria bacterium]
MMQALKNALKARLGKFRFGKASMALIALAGFLIGYNSIAAYNAGQCEAQGMVPPPMPVTVSGGMCACCAPTPCPQPCEISGTASMAKNLIWNAFSELLENLTDTIPPAIGTDATGSPVTLGGGLDGYTGLQIDYMMEALLQRLNNTEKDMMAWWDTMWYYNLLPALKDMTNQINTASVHQVATHEDGMDVSHESKTNHTMEKAQVVAHETYTPSKKTCVAAGASGGLGRGREFGRHVRRAMEREVEDDGLNNKGSPGAPGVGAQHAVRNDIYETTFCDPDDNGGMNTCKGTPSLPNMDTRVNDLVYGNLTIPMDDPAKGADYATATKELVKNMVGDPAVDPLPASTLKTSAGIAGFMNRRVYMARYNAIRTVPMLGIGWRTPGTNIGSLVENLRKGAGVPVAEISKNPSYKEVLHAYMVDRFNSGDYANDLIGDQSKIEMEKLSINSFYLMQLRDYYELLERTALALAVQVSVMADKIQLPKTEMNRSLK